jgi:glucokinase
MKKSTNFTLGIDLGGTKIMAVVVDRRNTILARAKADTPIATGVDAICARIKDVADQAVAAAGTPWPQIVKVGIAIPASVDPESGDALHAPALGWRNQPVRPILEALFGQPVTLANDVNCGTLASARAGVAHDCRCVVGYFLGTGLGGGIVIDGHLHTGKKGAAAELGHEIVRVGGRRCGCGKRGCIEAYASKTAFCKRFDKLIHRRHRASILTELTGNDFGQGIKSSVLRKAYLAGDPVTREVLHEGVEMLGVACANMMSVLGPDCIVLGGGVFEALGKELFPVVVKAARKNLFAYAPEDLDMRLTMLSDDAVPLGAALIARDGA